MAENHVPPAPDPGANRPSTALPRRNISAERQQGQTPGGEIKEHLADLVDSVMVLANHLEGESATPADTAKDRSGRRVKKFQRSGTVDDRLSPTEDDSIDGPAEKSLPPPPPAETDKPDAAAFNKNIAWPRQGGTDPALESAAPKVPPRRKRPSKKAVLIAVQAAGISLLALGFFAGRGSAPTADAGGASEETIAPAKSPDGGGSSAINESSLQVADAALTAAAKGDTEAARKLYYEALDRHVDLPGIHYQLARLAMEQNDLLAADLDLDRSSDAGEFVAACCYTRARFAGMKGNYGEAVRQFRRAAHADPFNARYFFYWGEALRRRGEPQNAIEVMGQALTRAHTADEGALYLFKQRLARVEAGGDNAFYAELDEHLKQPPVAAEWWLLAAARDITRAAFPAAAESIKKAVSSMPPTTSALWLKDYLFQAAQDEPSLSASLRHPPIPDSTERNGPFVDPAVLPAELADPAIWSVAASKNRGGS